MSSGQGYGNGTVRDGNGSNGNGSYGKSEGSVLSDRLPPQVMHYPNAPLFPKGYHVARQSGSLEDMADRKPET